MTTELRARLEGTLGGAYAIERELGGGGMSRVFVAEERRLGRKVVVKVLPPEIAGAISVERFTREIQVAARLQHPHIVPLLSAGEIASDRDGGTPLPYYTMPLVQGESLRERLAQRGKMAVADAVRVAGEVADALAYAHSQGVVHRDIKPENILLSGGHALVVDFGIAKALDLSRTQADASITATGVSIGTPAYMSPEQAAGESAIDGRSDIYSLAAVLYEMLTGQPPYTGPTAAALIAARFRGPPPALRTLDAAIPSGMERAVTRAMATAPEERFATAADFLGALRTVGSTESAGGTDPTTRRSGGMVADATAERSIAVLPFVNMSADPESEYFSDGMTEEIINALVHLPGLRVAARTSSFAFKGQHTKIGEIGEALNVATVLEGSVRRAGKRLRITAQLIKVADGFHLWSERYDRDLEDVFAIQDEIARAIADQLKVRLAGGEQAQVVRPPTANLEAHDLYLRGRHLWMRRGPGLRAATDFFRRAIAADPEFAAPYAGLADSETMLATYGYEDSGSAYARARKAAHHALELEATTAESHYAVGICEGLLGGDLVLFDRELARAAELNPSWGLPPAYRALFIARWIGRRDEAAELARRGGQIEPLSALVHGINGLTFAIQRRVDEAWAAAERTFELQPDSVVAHWTAGWVHELRGDLDRAIESHQAAVELSTRAPLLLGWLGSAYVGAGQRDDAMRVVRELDNGPGGAHRAAVILWRIGEEDEALRRLEVAARQRSAVFWVPPTAPGLESLNFDPRWHAILRSAGLGMLVEEGPSATGLRP